MKQRITKPENIIHIPTPDEVKRETVMRQMEQDEERQALSAPAPDDPQTATDCPSYPCDACRWKRDCEYSDA